MQLFRNLLPKRVKIFSALFFVFSILLGIMALVVDNMSVRGPIPVNKITSTGARVLVIRIPQRGEFSSEDITVYNASMSPPYLVTRSFSVDLTPKHELPTLSRISLTESQWQAIQNILRSWCASPPIRAENEKEHLSYTIGVRCPLPGNSFNSILLQIPHSNLPSELTTLMQRIPPIQ